MSSLLGPKLISLFILFSVLSGCTGLNNTLYGDSVIVRYGSDSGISCNNWQEGRHWELNGEKIGGDDKWCKGKGDTRHVPMAEIWDLEVDDIVEYIKAEDVVCSVTITQEHIDNEEAVCKR